MEQGAKILLEGNVFKNCKTPMTQQTLDVTSGLFNVATAADGSSCSAALGRVCQQNSLTGSGDFGSFSDLAAMEAIAEAASVWKATSARPVPSISRKVGAGKLG